MAGCTFGRGIIDVRVITLNVNGIRSAARKGFFQWLRYQRADVVCLQEIRAQQAQLKDDIFRPKRWHCYYADAARKGYSGVAIFSRRKPDAVRAGLGIPGIDAEARYLEARYSGISVASLYVPSGTSGDHRQQVKMAFLERFARCLGALRRQRREYVICGDFNIAHKQIDLENWRSNQKNSGFLPEERQWMDGLFGSLGYVDAFRVVDPGPRRYTWWSNRGRARAKNVGWRIDYQVITPGLRPAVCAARIYTAKRFSDHAPLLLDYDWPRWNT